MKTLKVLSICALSGVLFASCSQKSETIPGVTAAQVDSVSYAVGVSFGGMLKSSNLTGLDYNQVVAAMKDVVDGKSEIKITEQESGAVIQSYINKVMQAQSVINKEKQTEFLAKNKTEEGVQETESGLQYKIIEAGSDVIPSAQDTVEVHYKGTLLDGTEFDSSYSRGEAATFPLNAVIKGWTEGLQLIGEGGKATLWIPYELGYGERAMGPNLPAYSTLVFEVELIKVSKAAEATK